MATLAELVVKIGADTSALSKGLSEAANTIQNKMKAAEAGSKILLGAVSALGAAAVGVGVKSVIMAGNLEQSEIAFTTMLGSAQKAKDFLADLSDFAAKTPFEFEGLQNSSRQLLAFGFQAEQIIPMMTSIGNAVSGLGGGAFEIDRVTRALGQMKAKGKVSAEEMMQLAELGIPAWEILAEKIGVDIPTAMDMASRGAIPAAQAIEGIVAGMNERFPNMMEKQSTTLLSLWSTFKDNIGANMRVLGQEIIKTFDLKNKLQSAIETFEKFTGLLQDKGLKGAIAELIPPKTKALIVGVAGAIAGGLVPALFNMAAAFMATMIPLIPFMAAGAAIAGLAYLIYSNWGKIGDFFKNLWTGIKDTVTGAATAILEFIKNWGPLILAALLGPIGLIVYGIATHWDTIKQYTSTAWTTIKNTATQLGTALKDGIIGIWTGIRDFAVSIWDGIKNIVVGAFTWMYDHNYYFEALVDAIRAAWDRVTEWTTQTWNNIKTFVSNTWNGVVMAATKAWEAIKNAITAPIKNALSWLKTKWLEQIVWEDSIFNRIKSTITGVFINIRNFISGIVNNVFSRVTGTWSNITSTTSSYWSKVRNTISGIGSSIKNTLSGLASSAYNWGRNLLNSFINGIKSKISALTNIASNAASKVSRFLGFHSPAEEGPGKTADKWAPNLVRMYVEGIKAGIPNIRSAVQQMADSLSPINLPVAGSVGTYGVTIPAPVFQPATAKAGDRTSAADRGKIQIVIEKMYVRDDQDIKKIAEELHYLEERERRGQGK